MAIGIESRIWISAITIVSVTQGTAGVYVVSGVITAGVVMGNPATVADLANSCKVGLDIVSADRWIRRQGKYGVFGGCECCRYTGCRQVGTVET